MSGVEVRYQSTVGGAPELDEVIASNVSIHLEHMGAAQWWLGIRDECGNSWSVNVGAVNTSAKGYGHVEFDGLPVNDPARVVGP